MVFSLFLYRWEVVEGGETKTARDVRKHVEDNNGGSVNSVK